MKKDACMPDLQVKYCLPNGIDSELDRKIEKCLEDIGYKQYASGFCYVDGYRDLAFDKVPTKLNV